MSSPDLPTCWRCPKCGYLCDHQIDIHESKLDHHAWCREPMVESQVIMPGTPPEQILNLVGEVLDLTEDMRNGYVTLPDGWVVTPREEAKDV